MSDRAHEREPASISKDTSSTEAQSVRARPPVQSGAFGIPFDTSGPESVLALQRTAGNRAICSLLVGPAAQLSPPASSGGGGTLHRQAGKASVSGASGKIGGSVLVLGRYDRGSLAMQMRAALATGRRPMMMSELASSREMFKHFFPSGLASGSVVHEALEGASGLEAIYVETRDVDFYRGGPLYQRDPAFHNQNLGGQTSAEYRNIVAALAGAAHRVDVYIQHEGGLSVVKAGTHRVTGAPLPDALRDHLPPSMFPSPVPPSGTGTPASGKFVRGKMGGKMPGKPKVGGKIPGKLNVRTVRGAVGSAILTVALGFLEAWAIAKVDEGTFKREITDLEPEILARIEASASAAQEQYETWPDKPIYIALPIRLTYYQHVYHGQLAPELLAFVELRPGPDFIYPFPLETAPKTVSLKGYPNLFVRKSDATLSIPLKFDFESPGEREAMFEAVRARRKEFAQRAHESSRPMANVQVVPREDPVRKPQ